MIVMQIIFSNILFFSQEENGTTRTFQIDRKRKSRVNDPLTSNDEVENFEHVLYLK